MERSLRGIKLPLGYVTQLNIFTPWSTHHNFILSAKNKLTMTTNISIQELIKMAEEPRVKVDKNCNPVEDCGEIRTLINKHLIKDLVELCVDCLLFDVNHKTLDEYERHRPGCVQLDINCGSMRFTFCKYWVYRFDGCEYTLAQRGTGYDSPDEWAFSEVIDGDKIIVAPGRWIRF